ncbi:MAG: glycoside hydrolase family 57 protein [Candidatus Altiarchaeota archaeon]
MYFQVHQPYRLKWFWPGDANGSKEPLMDRYFDQPLNEWTFHKVAGKCYHPATDKVCEAVDNLRNEKRPFKAAYSLTGCFLDQCERWDPDLLEKFKWLASTKKVEFLAETYPHSLASLFEDTTEFIEEVELHRQTVKDLLGVTPQVFRNTELLYHNGIAKTVEELGFKGILTEGIERILEGWKSPNYVYQAHGCKKLKVLLRNYKLSDDIGYRFSAKWWSEWPLDAEKYAGWLSATPGETINIFMDYETFGEHQWEDTGIFWFLQALPHKILDWEHLEFDTPSEVISKYHDRGELMVPWYETVSWADMERDATAWLGNHMQHLCFNQLKHMEGIVKQLGDPEILRIWRFLLTSDHFYYMCNKGWGDGDVHCYFSHHGTPYDAGLNYYTILMDLREKVLKALWEKKNVKIGSESKPAKRKAEKNPKRE